MKKVTYEDFWQRVHADARKRSIPLRVMFELTYECNFRCPHCYIPESFRKQYRKSQLNTKQVFRVLDELKAAGCLFLGFTGGEPFTRPDILEILGYAKKQGFQVIIYTNGSLIDTKMIQELTRINPNKVDITIPGMTESVFESITGVPGSRRAVFKVIELLDGQKIPLGFKSCLLQQNKKEIKAIREFARSMGCPHRLDTLLSPCLNGSTKPYKFRAETPQAGIKDTRTEQDRDSCVKQKDKPDNLFPCGAGNSQAAITPAGELKLCVMIEDPKYNILKTTFVQAWLNIREDAMAIRPDKNYLCSGCDLRTYCSWCPARAWLYDKSFTSCDPQARKWAQKDKENYVS